MHKNRHYVETANFGQLGLNIILEFVLRRASEKDLGHVLGWSEHTWHAWNASKLIVSEAYQ